MQTQTIKKVGSLALGSSFLVLSMLPAAAAFAATNHYITNVTTTANGTSVSATSTTTPAHLKVWYQFRATTPQGHTWILRRFEASPTFKWTPPKSGTYHVQAFALTQYQVATHQWKAAVSGTTVTDSKTPQVSSISISGAPTANIGTNTAETLTVVAKNSSGTVVSNPGTPTWSLPSGTSGATLQTLTNGGTVFDATAAGTYTVTATLDGQTATAKIVVYGSPAAVKLSAASSSLAADGAATDKITATVVDSNGNTVANYSGTATIADSLNLIGSTGQPSDFTAGNNGDTLTFTNGVATFNLGPTTNAGETDTLTLTPPSSSNLAPATLNVATASPTVSGLSLAIGSSSAQDLAANSQSHVTVNVSTTDTAGNVVGSSAGTYATVTLSGPGSFVSGSTPGNAVTTESVYIPAGTSGGTTAVTVYSIVGETGTVTVSASSSGLKSGSTTVPSYLVGSPAKLAVKSTTGTDSNGNAYTQYTVSVLDSNGQAVPNATGSLSISNNATAQGGAIQLGTINSSGAFINGTTANPTTVAINNGVATFAVENDGPSGTSPVTLTMTDSTDSSLPSITAPYSFTAEAASQLMVSPSSYYTVKPGQQVTYSAQVADANGNPVSQSGVPVTFSFPNAADMGGFTTFPNGLSSQTVDTNGSGVASVTFTVPGSATGGSMQVAASAPSSYGLSSGNSATVNIESATDSGAYATQLLLKNGLASNATTVSSISETASKAGTAIQGNTIDAIPQNAVGGSVGANDVLQITSSNSNVVSVNTADETASSGSGYFNVASDLKTGMAGSATVTVKDISNPTAPSASFVVNVTPGPATQYTFEYQGAPIATTGLSVAANSPVALTVVNSDAAGDPIPVTGNSPVTVDVKTTAPNAELLGQVGGGPVSSVQIQPGASSATVYLESSVAESVTPGEFTATGASAASTITGLAYTNSTITVPQSGSTTDAVSTAPTVTNASGTVLTNSGSYSIQGPSSSASGVTIDSTTGTVSVASSATTGTWAVTYTQGSATETVKLTVQNGLTESVSSATPYSAGTATPASATLTVNSGASAAGTLTFTVNTGSAGGTTTTYQVNVTSGETAAQIATALANKVSVSGYTATASGDQVTVAENTATSGDAVSMSLTNGTITTGVTSVSSSSSSGGTAPTAASNTFKVTGGSANTAGSFNINVTAGSTSVSQSVTVTATEGDSAIATAIASALNGNTTFSSTLTALASSGDVTVAYKTAASGQSAPTIGSSGTSGVGLTITDSGTGLGPVAYSAGTGQSYALKVGFTSGSSASASGTLAVKVAGTTVDVSVTSGQDAAVIGDNIMKAINANSTLSAGYTATQPQSNTVEITAKSYSATAFNVSMADAASATGVTSTDKTTAYAAATATPESYAVTFAGTAVAGQTKVTVTITNASSFSQSQSVPVSTGDTAATVASNVASAINGNSSLSANYTATAKGDVVTIAQATPSKTKTFTPTVTVN